MEEEVVEKKERRESKEETKGRRGSNHSWSSLGRRRSKDGGARRRSRNERRGSDSSIGQSLHNTHRRHPFHNNRSRGIHSSPISIHLGLNFVKNLFQHLLHHSNRHYDHSSYSAFISSTRQQQEISIRIQTIYNILSACENLVASSVTTRIRRIQSKHQLSIYLTPPTPSAPLKRLLTKKQFLETTSFMQKIPQVLI